jgi:hypothetical protein
LAIWFTHSLTHSFTPALTFTYSQFITFVVTVVYSVCTVIVLIGGCMLTSPKVFGADYADSMPANNPARYVLYVFNTVVILVCFVYMTLLSHAMRVTKRFQRSVTSNLRYGHGSNSYSGTISDRSSSSDGPNSEGVHTGERVYSTGNSSERGTASSPPQFKNAINSVYRLFAINLLKVGFVCLSQTLFMMPALWPYQGYALGLASISLSTDLKSNVVGIYLPKPKDASSEGSSRTANGNTMAADAGGVQDSYQLAGVSFGDLPLRTVAEAEEDDDEELPSQGPAFRHKYSI